MADIAYKTFNSTIVDEDTIKSIVDNFIQIVNDKNADIDTSDIVEAECIFFSITYSATRVSEDYYIHLCKKDGSILFMDWYLNDDDVISFECRYHGDMVTTKTSYNEKTDEITVEQHSAY